MKFITYVSAVLAFCLLPLGAVHASSITYVSIDSSTSSLSRWDGNGFNDVYGVTGTIAVTIDGSAYISFNFDNVTTTPASSALGSPFAPDVFYDGTGFDNRGQYTCTGSCPPVVYDELWGTFDGSSLSFQGSGGEFDYQFSINAAATAAVPVPASGVLFASGMLGLMARRRKCVRPAEEDRCPRSV